MHRERSKMGSREAAGWFGSLVARGRGIVHPRQASWIETHPPEHSIALPVDAYSIAAASSPQTLEPRCRRCALRRMLSLAAPRLACSGVPPTTAAPLPRRPPPLPAPNPNPCSAEFSAADPLGPRASAAGASRSNQALIPRSCQQARRKLPALEAAGAPAAAPHADHDALVARRRRRQ
jgi:hypothetical protein